jgi:sulfate adenylyltransferase subunit 2
MPDKNSVHSTATLTPPLSRHLANLETEAIVILREAAASFERPVLMYSIGKDSSVLLHLCRKAFHPAKIPFAALHIDTTWKFRDMITFRDRTAAELDLNLIVHTNKKALAEGVHPIGSGSAVYTREMKTVALREALDMHRFDAAIGGARRDEEPSRSKERIFSVRGPNHSWDPRRQRPELWHVYNPQIAPDETMRVFPLSNWTELDVWEYILSENIPVVPLYFAKERPVVERGGSLIMVDDERLELSPGEQPKDVLIRFRSLGCYPLSAAVLSAAANVEEIVEELRTTRMSERAGRLIDVDETSSMERKKREGYF